MIRIYKDKDIKLVTKGAYETFYKPLGYNTIIETPQIKEEVKTEQNVQLNDEVIIPKRTRVSSNRKTKKED